ncbi:MAG: TlpA family protein disulfide reductase [Pirellulaceae bacterium]
MLRRTTSLVILAAVAVTGCQSEISQQTGEQQGESSQQAAVQPPAATSSSVEFQFDASMDPAESLADLKQQLQQHIDSLRQRVAAEESSEEQARLFAQHNPLPAYIDQLLVLAETHPESDAALQAALEAASRSKSAQKNRAMRVLFENFAPRLDQDTVIASLLQEVPSSEIESWLVRLIEHAPAGQRRADAVLGLKNYLDQLPVFRDTLAINPEVARRLPSGQLEYINTRRSDEQNAEIAGYLQTVIDESGDLEYDGNQMSSAATYAEIASRELFELQNLQVGQVAPDIVGEDLDGHQFALSEYRGKVVMLDFWGHWCPPCRAMYPHERYLVENMAGLPFALIGVNSDAKLETAQNSVRRDKLPWRNFWNGPEGTAGPIASQWNIDAWPTVYLIDADGVIRYKAVAGSSIDRGIETLMGEIGHQVDLSEASLADRTSH